MQGWMGCCAAGGGGAWLDFKSLCGTAAYQDLNLGSASARYICTLAGVFYTAEPQHA